MIGRKQNHKEDNLSQKYQDLSKKFKEWIQNTKETIWDIKGEKSSVPTNNKVGIIISNEIEYEQVLEIQTSSGYWIQYLNYATSILPLKQNLKNLKNKQMNLNNK